MANETLNIQNGVSPITIDTEVTEGSMRPVTSDGIYKAIQAGGGGGNSDVLTVVCTATNNAGTMSYSYSHTAEEAWAAINGGKIVDLKIRGTSGEMLNTVAVNSGTNVIFIIFSAQIEDHNISTHFTLHSTYWEELLPQIEHSQYILPFFGDSPSSPAIYKEYNVPMYIGTDNGVGFQPIGKFIDFGSTVQTLIMGAYSYAGTAIGTTISDPDVLTSIAYIVSGIDKNLSSQRPITVSFDTGAGIVAKAMLNDVRYDNGVLQAFSLSFSDFAFSSGTPNALLRFNLSTSLAYDNSGDISSATLVAFCDSQNITFV